MIDDRLRLAVEEATSGAGQSPELAKKLIAWLESVAEGKEDFSDIDKSAQRVELVFGATNVAGDAEDK